MKIFLDQTKLKRRALLSHIASLGGLFVLMSGVVDTALPTQAESG